MWTRVEIDRDIWMIDSAHNLNMLCLTNFFFIFLQSTFFYVKQILKWKFPVCFMSMIKINNKRKYHSSVILKFKFVRISKHFLVEINSVD